MDAHGLIHLHQLNPPEGVGALPILEIELAGITIKLTEAASVLQVSPNDLRQALPAGELFETAFDTRSDYWIDRALDWMEAQPWSGLPLALMRSAIADKSLGQTLRHRAQRVLISSELSF